jgi:transposase
VKNYIRSIKDLRPKPAYIRYETLPGEQAQVDWGHMKRTRPDGYEEEVYCFAFVLGYSRTLYIEYTKKRDLLSFMRAHQRAFEYLGGVPAKILYDHVKTVVLESLGKEHIWNESFMDFARFYGFKPDLCNVGEAHEKGKVEKVLDYIEKDFFIGTAWSCLDELNQKALSWLNEVANVRVHGTTNEVPFTRLKEEKLVPLGERSYAVCLRERRKVSKDCYISYKGNRYSIPHKYSLRQLRVKIYEEELKTYFAEELIAGHS